eukprot:scaffold51968_cov50-Phaeocystis_antarctica.AAC.3
MPLLVRSAKPSAVPRSTEARGGDARGGEGDGGGGDGGDDGGGEGDGSGGEGDADGADGEGGADGGGEGGGGPTIVVAIIVTSVCANPRPLSEAPASVVIAVLHKMMPSACASAKIVATPATCQKMLLALAPFWRTTFESAMKFSPWAICMIHTVSSSPSASK